MIILFDGSYLTSSAYSCLNNRIENRMMINRTVPKNSKELKCQERTLFDLLTPKMERDIILGSYLVVLRCTL